MTPDQLNVLRNEIANDPLGVGYSSMLPGQPGQVADKLNKASYLLPKKLMISERGIMDQYPDGPVAADLVLCKLENYAKLAETFSSLLRRVLKFLGQSEGIDIGSKRTQSMLDVLASQDGGNVITAAEASKLKKLADQPASRAEVLGLGVVTEQDLRSAGVI